MKNSFSAWVALAGALCLFSCAREEVVVHERVSYDCTLVANLAETRTANDGNQTLWVADDAISVMHSDDKTNFFSSKFTYSGENNAFAGRVTDVGDVNDWYLVYPYDVENTNPKAIKVTVPNIQTQNGVSSRAHLAGPNFPLVGKDEDVTRTSTTLNMSMRQVLASIQYDVFNMLSSPIVVKEVVFAAPVDVAGGFVGDLTAENLSWTSGENASANLTLNVEGGEQIPLGETGHFYVGSIPFTAPAGTSLKVKVTAEDQSGTEIVFYRRIDFSKDTEFSAGLFKHITIAFDDQHQDDPGSNTPTIKEDQTISFVNAVMTWTLGDTYAVGGQYDFPQEAEGAKTTVNYTSLNTDVVEVVNNAKILIKKTGEATIKAYAVASTQYNASNEATYTLKINEASVAPSERTYTYVSPTSLDEEDTYVIAGSENNELSVALFPTVGTKSWNSQATGSVTNGQYIPHKVVGTNNSATSFTTEDAEVIASEVKMVKNGSNWRIKVLSTGEYLSAPSQEYRISFGTESAAANFAISNGTSGASVKAGDYYFYHSGSAGGFTLRTNSTANTRFYKLESSKATQQISFERQEYTYTLGEAYELNGSYSLPQVNNAVTDVTYTSNNTSVVEIVEGSSPLKFKIKGVGTATITAKAAETASTLGATATTKITIKEGGSSNPTTQTIYKKVTGSQDNWAGTYLFVDDNSSKAFAAFSNVSNYAADVTIVTDGTDKYVVSNSQVDKYALTVTDAGVQHANASGQEAYDVRNSDGKYIYYSSNALQIADTNSKTDSGSSWGGSSTTTTYYYYHAFKYNNNGVQVLSSRHDSGSNKYYLGYVSNAFSYSNSSADGRRIQLYKLTEGSGSNIDPEKQNQTVSFSDKNVTWTLGDNYKEGSSYPAQTPDGTYFTTLKYESSNTGVVTVDGFNLKIVGTGTTTITATAQESTTYNAASDTYTLKVEAASTSGTTRTYTYQSSPSADIFLLGGYESTNSQYSIALFPDVKTGNWSSSQGEVTNGQYLAQRDINSDNTLTFTNDNEIFNAEVQLISSGSNWKIKVLSTGKYLAVPSQDNRIVYVDSESSATAFSISGSTGSGYGMGGSNNNTVGISSNNYYFYHSSSAHGFSMRAYQVTNIRLYKRASEGSSTGNKQDQNLRFENATVTWTLGSGYSTGGTYDIQNLTGAMTSVEYTSSNTNVATIQNGRIRIVAAGQTTIKATAQSNSQYNAAVAEYTLIIRDGSTPSGSAVYVKATSLTVGGTYLITDVDDQRLFKGNSDGSYVSVSPSGGVITDSNGSMSAYEFTVTQSGSKYCLIFNDGKYLLCDYSNSGNSTTGLTFESSKPSDEYLYTCKVTNGVFEFMTAQRNSTSTSEVLYYKTSSMSGSGQDKFKIGASGAGVGVHLYLKDGASGKQAQYLSFAESTLTFALQTASGTQQGQQVSGAQTSVSYSSDNENVVTVSTDGRTLTIKGFGTANITAKAVSSDTYYSATASYTVNVKRASQTGVFNLENEAIEDYFDRALTSSNKYTYDNHSSLSYVNDIYTDYGRASETNRIDWPAPATVTWTPSVSTSNATLSVYYDEAHTNEEIMAVPQISSTTADIYNLIPGKTYYWVLKSGNSTVASGHFETEGRRRMMGIGTKSNYGQNYANNCRDFGGQVTADGSKRIKFGRIYRGTNMDNTTSEQKKYLLEKMKIRLDVDLRTGDGSSSNNGNNTYNALKNNNSGVTMNDIEKGKYDVYVGHTQEQYSGGGDLTDKTKMGPTLMRIMNAIDHDVNVYIHCMVGADRTGGTCLYLESILGIPPERCDMDFELTSFSCVCANAWSGARTRNGSSPEQYYTVYNKIKNYTNGSTWQDKAINYCVNELGVDRNMITTFQNNMLEPNN